jgi:hypothetical protein
MDRPAPSSGPSSASRGVPTVVTSPVPSARMSALARPLPSGDKTISASSFGYLFSQLVQLCQGRVQSIVELERKCVCECCHDTICTERDDTRFCLA